MILLLFCLGLVPASAAAPVVYGVSPYYLSRGHAVPGLKAVRLRLAEIRDLGADVVWMQPITPPAEAGHGYDVVDFASVWTKLGGDAELKRLVEEAHQLGMRVMLDVVLNHSSEHHPFARDVALKGFGSPYAGFYQSEIQSGLYSRHLQNRRIGEFSFVHYFWPHLLNFNWNNPGLREYLHGVLEYWVREFGVDGFRFDASWAPSSRYPRFYSEISSRLRRVRPDLLLMAEDKAGYPAAYRGTGHPHLKSSGFDWAYDWDATDPDWISRWAFQLDPEMGETVFNSEDPEKAARHFARQLRSSRNSPVQVLRYLENNDTPGFRRHHSDAQARFAAEVLFSLPGVPLVYYGQETGNAHSTFDLPAFDPARPLAERDPESFALYRRLIGERKDSDLLSAGRLRTVELAGKGRVVFTRERAGRRLRVEIDFGKRTVRKSRTETYKF